MENQEIQSEEIKAKKSSYDMPCVKKALRRYYEKNKDKIREYQRQYARQRYHADPYYKEAKQEYGLVYYHARKQLKRDLIAHIQEEPSVATMG